MTGVPTRHRAFLVLVAAAVGFIVAAGALSVRDVRRGDGFDLVRWQVDTVANRWLFLAGVPFRDDPDHDEAIARYFSIDRTGEEARRLENVVERAIEGRIDAVLRDLGIGARIRLPASAFPPVDIELAASPRVLVVSPRDEIRRDRADLLRPDLGLDDAVRIEGREEGREDVSALVVGSGGLAAYPAVVSPFGSYASTVETAAHEWSHHYLTFYPLGIRYFTSADVQVINETVADIVGAEVARIVLDRWGDPTAALRPSGASPVAAASGAIDRNQVLRALRLEVDALLERGEVEQAEARMEEVRQELAAAGHVIRRINQAYFAWFGAYAARPDSVDPLGDQLREIRALAGDLRSFLEAVRGVTTRADVEATLERLRAGAAAS